MFRLFKTWILISAALADLYASGSGEQHVELLTSAAAEGDVIAQTQLGYLYQSGQGTPPGTMCLI